MLISFCRWLQDRRGSSRRRRQSVNSRVHIFPARGAGEVPWLTAQVYAAVLADLVLTHPSVSLDLFSPLLFPHFPVGVCTNLCCNRLLSTVNSKVAHAGSGAKSTFACFPEAAGDGTEVPACKGKPERFDGIRAELAAGPSVAPAEGLLLRAASACSYMPQCTCMRLRLETSASTLLFEPS